MRILKDLGDQGDEGLGIGNKNIQCGSYRRSYLLSRENAWYKSTSRIGCATQKGKSLVRGTQGAGSEKKQERFLTAQADRFAGAKRKEKASACSVRNDRLVGGAASWEIGRHGDDRG